MYPATCGQASDIVLFKENLRPGFKPKSFLRRLSRLWCCASPDDVHAVSLLSGWLMRSVNVHDPSPGYGRGQSSRDKNAWIPVLSA